MLTAEGRKALQGNYKLSGQHAIIDGYYCFVGNERGQKVIYDKVPLEQHEKEMAAAHKILEDLKRVYRGEITPAEHVKRNCK